MPAAQGMRLLGHRQRFSGRDGAVARFSGGLPADAGREKHPLPQQRHAPGTGLEPEGCLHDASWDAYNSARLMETAHSPNFAADVAKAQAACYQEAPRMQGGLPLDVMKKLAALLQSSQPEPAMAV